MSFSSAIPRDCPIINDDTVDSDILCPPEHGRGLDLSLRGTADYAYGGVAAPFPDELLIPESEWEARIKEREELKATNRDWIRAEKIPQQIQGHLNYCWVFSSVHCIELKAMKQGQSFVKLAPESVGGPLTNYQNVGGWGRDALARIKEVGCVPRSMWPEFSLDSRNMTAAAKEAALPFRHVEFIELQPKNIKQAMSILLRGETFPGGFLHWMHQVSVVDPLWLDGAPAFWIRNQWPGWGDDLGGGIMQGSKMLFDDGVCPLSVIARG